MYALDVALQSKFTGDSGTGGVAALATGGVHKIVAPQESAAPFLTWQNVSSVPEYSFGQLAKIACTYLLKAYADGLDWDAPQAIIERAIAILFDASWTVSGYEVRSRGSNQFDSQEDVDGKPVAVTVGYVQIDVMPV
jgi:ABC-type amino acid transport substrate-binding protein